MREKLVILGLDGFDWGLFNKWKKDLPNLSSMKEGNVGTEFKTTIPPVTVPAWLSYSSGKNPTSLGVYDWFMFDKNEKLKKRTRIEKLDISNVWNYLEENKSLVVNIPGSFPPEPINGCMVTSIGTPSLDSSYTYPQSLAEEIEENVPEYTLFPDLEGDVDERFEKIKESMKSRFKLIKFLVGEREWDFLTAVISAPDQAGHKLLSEDEGKAKEIYKEVDGFLEYFLKKDFNVIVISDHGFEKIKKEVCLNRILEENGFLQLNQKSSGIQEKLLGNLYKNIIKKIVRGLGIRPLFERFNFIRDKFPEHTKFTLKNALLSDSIDWNDTEAIAEYSAKTGFIHILEEGKSKEVKNTLKKNIPCKISIEPSPEVWGEEIEEFPDLVIRIEEDDFNFSSSVYTDLVKDVNYSTHNYRPVFFASGLDIRQGNDISPRIIDLAPTVLHYFNEPVPEDIDGRVLKDLFKEGSEIRNREVEYREGEGRERKEKEELESKVEEKVKERLEELGYI